MFIQSDDYVDFVAPILIKESKIVRHYFKHYMIVTLEKEMLVNTVQCGIITTDKLIVEHRLLGFLFKFNKLPLEVSVLTPNYYSSENKECKCLIAIAYLYDGFPEYK